MGMEWNRREDGEVWYTSPLLDSVGARHMFTTRLGGVSEGPFGGWNFASGVGEVTDEEEKVLQNYAVAASKFGLSASDVCRSYQTHTDHVITVDESHRGVGTVRAKFPFGVDGLVSKTKDLLLSVRSADCVPILLYDPVLKVCAAVHSGWKGTAKGIVKNAVSEMQKHASRTENLHAAIGPCIGSCCYEVGREVHDAFLCAGERLEPCFRNGADGKFFLDLTLANRILLENAGVPKTQIDEAHLCTRCGDAEFFSHRRMGAVRGTMSAFITV